MPLVGDEKRSYEAAKSRERSNENREIGPPPAIVNKERRDSCRDDLRHYLVTYHPSAFPLAFGDDHLRLIDETQNVIRNGGNVVAAFPRGSGKTTIFQRAILWAALYGHRKYLMLLTADDKKYKELLRGIKRILQQNALLFEDFPEVIHPVRELEGVAIRAGYQMCHGEPTHLAWGNESVVFPVTQYTTASGSAGTRLSGGGLTGAAIRGSVATLPNGEQMRPDCVLIDDPQTRKSATSESQCQEREDICNGDILGMAGPGKTIAAMVACTVIRRNDLAERLLDRERSPSWTAIKVPMIRSWPKRMDIWEQYDGIRRQVLMDELEAGSHVKFYEQHRAAMDEAGAVYWPERMNAGCASALQSAMDAYFTNPRSFMAEFQNEPEETLKGDLAELNPLVISKRVNQYRRGQVPADVTTVTAHVDVQAKLVFFMVCGWTPAYRGYVIDYGTLPKRPGRSWTLLQIKKDLTAAYPGNDFSGAIRAVIVDTIKTLNERDWIREDGAKLPITRGLVDSGYMMDDVEQGIALAKAPSWMPARGVGIGAKDAPITTWRKGKGAVSRGHHWIAYKPELRKAITAFYDTNFWKTTVHQALTVAPTHSQSVTLYHESPSHHQMIADHWSAERAVRVEAKGRTVDEWSLPASKHDNHWWDCLVGNFVAASIAGIKKESQSNVVRRVISGPRIRGLKI